MPRTRKPKPERVSHPQPHPPLANGIPSEVLTLAETAAYLRLAEAEVLCAIDEQNLPARRVGEEWRFLKTAVQTWLSTPSMTSRKHGIWDAAGALKDDPYLEEMLKEIDTMRGRPISVRD